ncbi:hypothetical protein [Rhizobium sp. RCC_161_2]
MKMLSPGQMHVVAAFDRSGYRKAMALTNIVFKVEACGLERLHQHTMAL